MRTHELTDEEHVALRDAGLLICRCPEPDPVPFGECRTCRRLVITPEAAAKHGASRCDSCGEYTVDLHRVARRNGHADWCWDCWEIWAEEAAS